MPFKLNAYLPSKKQEVQIGELYYKQYRELVKSLYNTDKKETIQQYNSILQDLCSDIKDIDITIEDKLSLLLTIRNYCVSPDLKLKCTLPDKTTFNYTIPVDTIITKVKNINKSGKVTVDDIAVEYSSYKVRDEHVFLSNNKDILVVLASYIDNIKTDTLNVDFKDFPLNERTMIINSLPQSVVNELIKSIVAKEEELNLIDLILVKDPTNDKTLLRLSCSVTFEVLQKMIEFLFTENLNNIYRTLYNAVKHLDFTPEYVDSITPVEIQVYWMYFMQDKAEAAKNNTQNPSPGFNPPTSTPNSELGF